MKDKNKVGKHVPQSKQRDLKRKGKGNKPNASAALSEEDIQVREMSSKCLQCLRRKATRGSENRRCTVLLSW